MLQSRSMFSVVLSTAFFALLILGSVLPASAQVTVRVPQDDDLQGALDTVRLRGGTVEISAGTYTAPNRSFRIRHTRGPMTVRAAVGAEVFLEGSGANPILRFENDDRSRSERVFFENLTFRDGFSDEERVAGAVTLVAAEASFVGCSFENSTSQAPTTGGGGVLVASDSDAVFIDSSWIGNTAKNRGGGLAVLFSRVEVQGGEVRDNRVNLPGHALTAVGGGIFVQDSRLRVVGTHFEGNQAAWVGGALYVFGSWTEPLTTPAAQAHVFDSTFRGNFAQPDDCCVVPGPTSGGAIHVEDHATVRLYRALLEDNHAELGGALDSYRGIVEIFDSVLRGNFTELDRSSVTAGGAIFLSSVDFPDATTDFGAINRRPAELLMEGTLVEGLAAGAASGENGGCLFAAGDFNRRFGDGGVLQDGTVEDNRATVRIVESAFVGCSSEAGPQPGSGFGGAINSRLTHLQIQESLVLSSTCLADNCGGGGLAAFEESLVEMSGSTFAGNGADRGGGIFLSGSTAAIDGSLFFANTITEPDGSTNILNSRGAAIFAIPGFNSAQPTRATDVDGEVRGCTFSDHLGLPIFDVDTDQEPNNTVVYNDNDFFTTVLGDKVYANNLVRASGESASQLNALVVRRGDGSSTDKSTIANVRLTARPTLGHTLATPRQLFLPAGELGPATTHLPFAFSGSGAANLGGTALAGSFGVVETTTAGTKNLRVGATVVDTASVAGASCTTGPLLCLRDDRFTLEVDWARTNGLAGLGQAVQLTPDTGYFFFFNPDNVEMVVKALFGCPQTGNFWVFAGGLTNVETEIRVVDSLTGFVRDYENPQSTPFQPIQDTAAFPTCDAAPIFSQGLAPDALYGSSLNGLLDGSHDGPLLPQVGTSTLSLDDGRFEVDVRFETPGGQTGEGQAVQLTPDTGYFFFFNEANVEMVVKILRGCGANGNYWVFAGGLTNVEVEMTVTDTQAGISKTYTNPQRTPFQPIQDVRAFPTCP